MFDNTLKLTKFMLRRERVTSLVWILAITFVVVGLVPFLETVFFGEDMSALIGMMNEPTMIAMVGPGIATINNTFGALYTNFMLVFVGITVGIMNIFLVIRHTRADEEQWRYEVVRSLPTGRLANINAAMITAVIVNVALAVLMGLGIFALGDETMSFSGSMLWGAANGAIGLLFAAVAALFAQLSASSRSATSYSFVAMILFYFMRAGGDMQSISAWDEAIAAGVTPSMNILSLISPLGMMSRTYAFAGDYWWPVLIILGVAMAAAALAYKVNAVRDIDQGVIPSRPGRRDGGRLMKSHKGLAIRLTRTLFIWWAVLMFLLGVSYATIFDGIGDFVAHNEMYQGLMFGPAGIEIATDDATGNVTAYLEGVAFRTIEYSGEITNEIVALMNEVIAYAGFTIHDLFASMIMNLMALVSVIPVLLFVLKPKAEEKAIRTELLLATPVCKIKYLVSYAVIAFVAAVVMQVLLVAGMYVMGITVIDPDMLSFGFLMEAALAYVPAMWVMAGVTALLVGLLPKATGAVWGFFAYSFLAVFIGRMPGVPRWPSYLAPISFTPQLPIDPISWPVMIVLTLVGVGLVALGAVFYRRRDINAITN